MVLGLGSCYGETAIACGTTYTVHTSFTKILESATGATCTTTHDCAGTETEYYITTSSTQETGWAGLNTGGNAIYNLIGDAIRGPIVYTVSGTKSITFTTSPPTFAQIVEPATTAAITFSSLFSQEVKLAAGTLSKVFTGLFAYSHITPGVIITMTASAVAAFSGSFNQEVQLAAGALSKAFSGSFSNIMTLASAAKSVSYAGSYQQIVKIFGTGTLVFSGPLPFYRIYVAFVNSVGYAGSFAQRVGSSWAQAVSFTGSYNQVAESFRSGSAAFSGVFNQIVSLARAASVAFSGSFSVGQVLNLVASAALSFSGAFNQAFHSFGSNALALAGAYNQIIQIGKSAGVIFQGYFSTGHLTVLIANGVAAFSGAFNQAASHFWGGAVAFTGQFVGNIPVVVSALVDNWPIIVGVSFAVLIGFRLMARREDDDEEKRVTNE
jgi:hypothetical protein